MAHPIEGEKTDTAMNNRNNILNGSSVYNLRLNNCVKVNVIIRDETSEIAMMWKPTSVTGVTTHYVGIKKKRRR